MRALLTGISGTVGGALRQALEARGDSVQGYTRDRGVIDVPASVRRTLDAARPDVLFHLATASRPTGLDNEGWRVNVEWSALLAQACAERGVRMIFTSTAMVFTDNARGPFTVDSQPDAREGYGHEKRIAEARVRAACPDSVVVRLGWQIGDAPGGNQMLTFLDDQMKREGVVRASTRWLPACSFLPDTAEALVRLVAMPPGLYQCESNVRWSFFEIAQALNARAGGPWRIEPNEDFVYDQRLVDARLAMPPLSARLSQLLPRPE